MIAQTISVEKGTFRSPLLPIITALFALAAVCGALALGTLFHPSSIPAILHDMELGQIYDPNAQQTWLVIYIAVTAVNCLGALILSVGLLQVLAGRHHQGMNLLYYSAKGMLLGVNVSGAAVLPYFIFRAVRYIILCCSYSGGLVPLYSMILMEGLMGAQAAILFVKLRQFLNCSMDAAASIGYTLSSGKLNAPTIAPFSVTGFLVLTLLNIAIAMDRFFTFIQRQMNLHVIHEFPLTKDPVQFLSGLSFAFGALGCFMMFLYLRGYKNKSETLLCRPVREI